MPCPFAVIGAPNGEARLFQIAGHFVKAGIVQHLAGEETVDPTHQIARRRDGAPGKLASFRLPAIS